MRSSYPTDPWDAAFNPSIKGLSNTDSTITVSSAPEWVDNLSHSDEEDEPPRGRRRDSKELPHLSSNPSSPNLQRLPSLSPPPPKSEIATSPRQTSSKWYQSAPPLNVNRKLHPVSLSTPVFQAHHHLPPIPVVPSTSAVVTMPSDPILYLPPLLSRLPTWVEEVHHHSPSSEAQDKLANFDTRLPDIDPASLALHQALHFFTPLDDKYAGRKYDQAFNWAQLHLPPSIHREWYCVVFRSRRKPSSSSLSLYAADREAHEEAVMNGGLIMYWYGVPDSTGLNLATCIWQSRGHAIKAISGPKHREAMKQAKDAYEIYDLERWVLSKDEGKAGLRLNKWEGGEVGW